ncbi:hypothetical protein EDD11_005220 [Mortierella claussenii]|nr:hypothetical protein EDD11_005220 [Mortierella claussenii]
MNLDSSLPLHDQIQEQRRALSEETVSYSIYLPTRAAGGNGPNQCLDQQDLNDHQSRQNAALNSVQLDKMLISSMVNDLVKDYIWHKDAFSLRVVSGTSQAPSGQLSQPYLKGQTRIGDSLDDEWLIVFLLREITKRIPGSIAKVQDNDGEFLLVEAADHIPSWLDPDNSDNRVFIFDGNLHIVPIAITAEQKKSFSPMFGSKTRSPKLQDALDIIRASTNSRITTLAEPKVQQAAFEPLLPDSQENNFATRKIQGQRHFARCQIPVDVARILKERPELITRACEAFYTRDALGMAACSRMSKFLPVSNDTTTLSPSLPTSPSEAISEVARLGKNANLFVTTAVCFTKTCYAQLMGQNFQPPKAWDGIVPPPRTEDSENPQRVKEAELGMKMTCGFEILCSSDYPDDFGFKSGEDIQLEDFPFETDHDWRVFKSALIAREYFENERPESKRYKHLEEAAKQQFLELKSDQLRLNDQEDSSTLGSISFRGHGYHPVQEIERILAQSKEDQTENDIAILVDDRKDDDDSWMNVDLQILEDMMRARGFGGADSRDSSKGGLDMQEMLDRFGEFVQEGEGGFEGAEFLDELSDEDEEEDEDQKEGIMNGGAEGRTEDLKADKDIHMSEGDDSDEDIYASDYEERQAKKLAARQGGLFVFGSELMEFDTGVDMEDETADTTHKTSQAFVIDHEKLKEILAEKFGARPGTAKAREAMLNKERDEEQKHAEEQELHDYMAALDAELSRTKIGESFEKISVVSSGSKPSVSIAASNKLDKGKSKGKATTPLPKAPKQEKNLEELMKEYTERSRRGFSRHGPLGSGSSYGYDPAAMALADDEDGEDDEGVEGMPAHVGANLLDDEVDDEILEDDVEQEVVDVDLNLVKNLLESFKSQGGLPGPGGNLLSRLGIVLPRDEEDDENENDD